MATDKLARFIERVAAKTAAGDIHWEFDHDGDLVTSVAGHRLYLRVAEGEHGDPDYYIGFLNEDGAPIDSYSDVEMKDLLPNAYRTMQSLYKAAHREASGVSRIVSDILRELGDIEDF